MLQLQEEGLLQEQYQLRGEVMPVLVKEVVSMEADMQVVFEVIEEVTVVVVEEEEE